MFLHQCYLYTLIYVFYIQTDTVYTLHTDGIVVLKLFFFASD